MTTDLALRLGAIAIIFLTGLVAGLAPLRLGRTGGAKLFSRAGAAAAGVFLAAGLVHMLPDAGTDLSDLAGFPLPFFLAGIGFLLVFGIEKALMRTSELGDAIEQGSAQSPYILALVLSIHSIIAGASLGAEPTIAGAAVIFIAIIGHKGTAAFALGVSLVRARVEARAARRIVATFSSMTPFGVALGMGLSAAVQGRAEALIEGVFDAIAAGTFLYVATLDIIPEEFAGKQDRRLKFALLAAGFGFMSLLALWT